jgi:hypothetical protein
MGLGPATLTAVSKQLVPFLMRAVSLKAYEQVLACVRACVCICAS